MAWTILGAAPITYLALRFVVAPYGRHVRGGWGPTVPERLGWMLMESPSLVLFSVLFFAGPKHRELPPMILWAMWAVHYTNRTVLHPLRIKARKRMPLVILLLALAFNIPNATMNASWISSLGDYPSGWVLGWRFLFGALLFVTGMAINQDADRRLFALRARGDAGYAIPHGGLFTWVSCPNYLGEIIEWTGWALASWSLGGAAFAVYTVANLAPRATAHHAWYRRTFPDYPVTRKALIP